MKTGSEYKVNVVAKYIKKPFTKMPIIARFRISLAFNSLFKLFMLSVVTSLSISSLIFSITINGKFDYASQKTFGSRNYSYAVDLYTPTQQSGQYIPTPSTSYGDSG
jgi:putative ABC transport system permease protein